MMGWRGEYRYVYFSIEVVLILAMHDLGSELLCY